MIKLFLSDLRRTNTYVNMSLCQDTLPKISLHNWMRIVTYKVKVCLDKCGV